jgi:hypothetical protein
VRIADALASQGQVSDSAPRTRCPGGPFYGSVRECSRAQVRCGVPILPLAPDALFAIGRPYRPIPSALALDDEHLADRINALIEANTIEQRYCLPAILTRRTDSTPAA